jgi:hypothetical protein
MEDQDPTESNKRVCIPDGNTPQKPLEKRSKRMPRNSIREPLFENSLTRPKVGNQSCVVINLF